MGGALRAIDGVIALPGPHVVHNGAQVRAGGRVLAAWPLDAEAIAGLVATSQHLDAYAELYLSEGYVITKDDPRARPHWELLGQDPLGGIDQLDGQDVLKATFIGFDAAESDRIVRAIADLGLEAGPAGSPLTPDLTYVNATAPNVDKGRALMAAAHHLGTTVDRTVAIGDGDNDRPMLAIAGTAIAMGQANDNVRAGAHLVTGHVDEGGLATAIDAILQLRIPATSGQPAD